MKDLFRPDARLLVAMLLAWLPLLQFAAAAVSQDDTVRAIHYQIVKHGDAWQLLVDGKPLYLKGAVGWSHFDVLRQCGGNAVRTRATKASLDRAHAHGLKVMAGLPVRGERSGMDWGDSQQVAQQKQKVLAVVEELKDHPALMAWVVGNELDWIPPGVPHHPSLWERLNDLAVAIGRLDPHHPVLTVVGTGRYQQKTRQIAQSCPDMDLLGINAYGDLEQVTELTRKHWPKPYVVAEWGPTGHWQVPKTNWRVPLEQTSTEKAQAIRQRYTRIIQADEKHCLGSFVFLWGQKQETTHTWYGMFRDGRRTESVDVMQHLWSGAWPANRAPAVRNIAIEGFRDRQSVYLSGQGSYRASVDCSDPDDDRLTFQWDIRPEVEIPKNSYAGGLEKPARPIPGLIGDPTTQTVRFTAPADSGPYRLFVEVTDLGGSVGYANLPFYVEDRTAAAESLDASRFEHFVTRDGDRLMEGDKPLRFVGVNMPGLVLPYDYWANRPDRMVLPSAWEQEDGFKTLSRMHMGCVRTWNLPIRKPGWPKEAWQYVWGPGEFNEEAFVTLDRVLALANKYGVRVMIPLTADAGDYLGGVAEYAAHRGKDRKAFFSDPQVTADFKTTIRYVLTRVNTVTGVPYKDDKAVLAWQFGNEMDRTRPGDEIQRRWQAEMAAYVKSIDPNHLVAYGRRFFPEEPDPNIDIVVHHYYGSDWARRLPGRLRKDQGKAAVCDQRVRHAYRREALP